MISERLIVGALSLTLAACPSSTRSSDPTASTQPEADLSGRLGDAGAWQAVPESAGALSREKMIPIVMAGRKGVLRCFDEAADCAAMARFRIAPSGDVTEVSARRISGKELAPTVRQCIESEIKKWKFPPAPGDTWLSHNWECKKD